SRSIVDFEKIYNFLQNHHVDLVSLHENFDTTTAIGRAVVRIVLVSCSSVLKKDCGMVVSHHLGIRQ
ncbi:MAG: hypothetical protein DRQ24_10815, partial [Candidatus Latescibacterota bacterium]